jgi:NitT/TauT family transport system substrate-binding protein
MSTITRRGLGRLGLAGTAAFAMPAIAQAPTRVVLRTDFLFNGYVAPFALALERGFFREAGIDCSIEQGQGSGTTIQTVASGADTFGIADAATAILGITAQRIPVRILSVYTQTATMGLIYHPDSGFTGDLAQIRGKVVISSAGSADLRLLDAALATANLRRTDVQLQLVDANARVPLFLRTPGAFLTGFATGDYLRVRSRLPDARYVPYARYGVIAYGTGLIASNSTIEGRAPLVRGFVNACRRGWEAALQDQDAAIAASVKLYPNLAADFLRDGLRIALEQQLHTPATRGKPIGWTEEADWAQTIEVLKNYAGLTNPREPSAYYTNQFIQG